MNVHFLHSLNFIGDEELRARARIFFLFPTVDSCNSCVPRNVHISYEGISGTILNDTSEMLLGTFRDFPRSPRMAMSVLFKSVNLIQVRMWFITWEYSSFVFHDISSATFLWNFVHSGAIPPVVVNTKGVNVAFSTCITRWLYLLFFSLSFCWYIFSTSFPL